MLHFKINKRNVQQSSTYNSVQYAFEREAFDSIPSLIMHHVGRKIPISVQTGAVIKTPVNRDMPLSYSDVKHESLKKKTKPNNPISPQATIDDHRGDLSKIAAGSVLLTNDHSKSPLFSKPTSPLRVQNSNHSNTDTPSVNTPQPFPLHLPDHDDRNNNSNSNVNTRFYNKDVDLRTTSFKSIEKSNSKVKVDQVGPLPSIKPETQRNVPPKPSRVPSFRKPIIRHDSSQMRKSEEVQANKQIKIQETSNVRLVAH